MTGAQQTSAQHLPTAIIVAMTRKRVTGRTGALPWHLPEDLQLFRRLTLGQTVIMGRRTFESLSGPLPGRSNIVISRSLPNRNDLIIRPTFLLALAEAMRIGNPVFFIGGTEVYRRALAIADDLHISWVDADPPGDTYFPDFDRNAWHLVEETPFNGFTYTHFRRRKDKRGQA